MNRRLFHQSCPSFSAQQSMNNKAYSSSSSPFRLFDMNVKRLHRQRQPLHSDADIATWSYLRDEVGERVVDRLLDITRKRWTKVLDYGCGAGGSHLMKWMDIMQEDDEAKSAHSKVPHHASNVLVDDMVLMDISENLVNSSPLKKYPGVGKIHRVVQQEPGVLPPPLDLTNTTTENTNNDDDQGNLNYDACLSNLSLHWENDLLGTLIQIRKQLKPDGVFIGALFGGDTLYELRTAFQLAQLDRQGGISPHVSPMADMKDMGSLLSRAGFTLTTVDIDEIVVHYPSPMALMQDLQAMGESNAVFARNPAGLNRDTLVAMCAAYESIYGQKNDIISTSSENGHVTKDDGNIVPLEFSIPATFQIIYLIGWNPSDTQAKPLPRGSAQKSMKDALELKS